MADMTTKSPAELIKDYVDGRVPSGELSGWAFFYGKLPASPDKVITLIDQGGLPGIPNLLVDFPGLQILVRGERGGVGYNTGWVMMRKIRDAVLGMPNHPAEFPELDGVTERGTIVPLGYDDSDRHTWSCNFNLIVEPAANAISHRESL